MRIRSWSADDLRNAAKDSTSIRQVLTKLHLQEAGGNYIQIKKYINRYHIPTRHFTGRGWNRGLRIPREPLIPLAAILVKNNYFQSFKLKRRLIAANLKSAKCEECGWAKKAKDGRVPLELDHANGDRMDNRLKNLRILCPNCHSLKPTHRGLNRKKGGWRNWNTQSA